MVTPFEGSQPMPTIKLRQDNVRTVPYRGSGDKHQCIYWDEALENFGVRVYSSGIRTYVCSYRVRSRKRLAKIGRVTIVTLDEARRKARKILGKVADNEDPKEESDKQRELKTVDQLCLAYVENHARKKKKTWKNDKSLLDRHIRPKLGARLAIDITSADVEPIHAAVGSDHPYAANSLLEVVRKMFNWGEVAGYVPKGFGNPTRGIVQFPRRKRRRYITTAEMPRYLEALELEDNDYARNGLWLLLLMGLRSSELLNAKWVDIDWHERTLFIGLTRTGSRCLRQSVMPRWCA